MNTNALNQYAINIILYILPSIINNFIKITIPGPKWSGVTMGRVFEPIALSDQVPVICDIRNHTRYL